jgi:[acyl-carrier-protein] S-malonyltransferase
LSLQINSSFIFPAFINEYSENPFEGSPELLDRFRLLLNESSFLADQGLAEFDFISNNFLSDELRTQCLTYIYSCSVADILSRKGVIPAYSAGYSIGIYAALVQANALSFSDGLFLVRQAYETITRIVSGRKYGMCSIIGLNREDINGLISSHFLGVEITNQNSEFAFVLSGLHEDILRLLNAAVQEGALHTHLLNVSLPYHSSFLKESRHSFGDFVGKISFTPPQTNIISLIDQHILKDPTDIREEVVKNLFTPLNWYRTQSDLVKSGINLFVECGMGKNLVKNSKFIEGDYKFYSAHDYLEKQKRNTRI